jgi:hypothetical protein
VAVVALCSGCAGTDATRSAHATTTTKPAVASVDLLRHPEVARTLLHDRVGDAPAMRRLSLGHHRISVQVRDPAAPDEVRAWTLDGRTGRWSSTPVRLTAQDVDTLDRVTFRSGDIAWDALAGLVTRALHGLHLGHERVERLDVDRVEGLPPRIYVAVDGTRGDGRLLADADGTGVEISRL